MSIAAAREREARIAGSARRRLVATLNSRQVPRLDDPAEDAEAERRCRDALACVAIRGAGLVVYRGTVRPDDDPCPACRSGQDPFCRCLDVQVDINGRLEPLDPRLDLSNGSPTGFAWGYGGSGPAQLALALAAHAAEGDDDLACQAAHAVKANLVARWTQDEPWTLDLCDLIPFVSSVAASRR